MHSLIYLKPLTLPKLNAAREEYPCEIELRKIHGSMSQNLKKN